MTARVSAREPSCRFEDHPRPGRRGGFEPERVWIEEAGGAVVEERRTPRAAFRGRRHLWWDHLDLLHFAGYALWGYMTQPFLFSRPGSRRARSSPGRRPASGAAGWRSPSRPTSPPTPASRSSTWTGRGASAATTTPPRSSARAPRGPTTPTSTASFDGLLFPTRRRVYPGARSGRPLRFPLLVRIDVARVEVSDAPAP